MTLRLRLVLGLVILTTVAQVGFFLGTYFVYRNSEFQHLDAQLRSSEPVIDQLLDSEAHRATTGQPDNDSGSGPPVTGNAQAGGGPNVIIPAGTYSELLSPTGTVLSHDISLSSKAGPKLPTTFSNLPSNGKTFTVDATSGGTTFRVLAVASRDEQGSTITVIAIPTTEVDNALHRLLLIEAGAIGALLVVVSAGAWFILARGLHPLERMARTARRITAGDLSQRVTPAGGRSEIGQLGLAINTMLGDIETSFAEVSASEERLRQFLADASHELRTPLTSIQGFAELFRVSGANAAVDLPTILRRIEEEAARMKVLVEDLLLLARLDEHRAPEREPVDLVLLAADACTDAVATDPTRPVHLDATDPVMVEGDEAHLRQAVANLVTNAIRHTPAGTPLEVSASSQGATAFLTVRDHGPGLDEESLNRVFDRFWQGDKARVGHGAGLGLSIVAAIAAEHGGHATAANAPDGGAVFTLELPAQPVPALTPTS